MISYKHKQQNQKLGAYTKMPEGKKPDYSHRQGSVSAAAWKNVSKEGKDYFSISVQKRSTKDDGVTWDTETIHLFPNELVNLLAVLTRMDVDVNRPVE